MTIRPLIDAESIARRVSELGARITAEYEGHELALVAVLKGSFVFASDLIRHIDLDVTIDFLGVRSYGDSHESSGVVEITTDLRHSIEGRHVVLVEDIVDTGLTVAYLRENLETRQPASLKIASLLHKPARTKVAVDIDYLGFTIDDVFIVGYGLDYAQNFRNLPFLGVVEPSAD